MTLKTFRSRLSWPAQIKQGQQFTSWSSINGSFARMAQVFSNRRALLRCGSGDLGGGYCGVLSESGELISRCDTYCGFGKRRGSTKRIRGEFFKKCNSKSVLAVNLILNATFHCKTPKHTLNAPPVGLTSYQKNINHMLVTNSKLNLKTCDMFCISNSF